ncbi:MAG TPA: methyltransferase domain-containing protein [Candidatus Saccharimonadales bacterium]|nr:methyltransferase domain-containing protein [Candidatus Saccharimonadales bacterium]
MEVLYIFFWVVWAAAIALIFAYSFVLLFGAPYFPSLDPHVKVAFKLLDLKKGQTVYDLGCGDGRFLRAAAQRGIKAVGYELNPFMFVWAWLATRRYRHLVSVRLGNFWKADISQADAVFVFLLTKFMKRLDDKLAAEGKKGLKVASHAFKIPGKKPLAKEYGVFLYKY